MARTGENIYKRKDGRWEARYIKSYSFEGKAKYGYVYSKTYSDVKSKQIAAINNLTMQNGFVSSRYLFSEIAEKWLQNVKSQCKASTYNKYRNIYNNQLKKHLEKIPVSKISEEMIIELIQTLLINGKKDGGALSNKTVQDAYFVIKQIFNFADIGFHIHTQINFKHIAIKQKPKDLKILSNTSIKKLCDFLLADMDLYKIGVLISLYTGLRIGELCALQWKDISFEDQFISISKTVQRIQQLDNPYQKTKLYISEPKSSSSNRIIPIPKSLLDLLIPIKKDKELFVLSGTNKCIDPRIMQHHFKKYLQLCEIEEINFHALRHTFASRCIELGFDAKTLSEILGHSSVNITLNRYVHSSIQLKRNSMNKLIIGS